MMAAAALEGSATGADEPVSMALNSAMSLKDFS